MVAALFVLEGPKSTLVAKILSILEGLAALEGFSLMANIAIKIRRIFGGRVRGVCLYIENLQESRSKRSIIVIYFCVKSDQ